jgi:hypothetical protein
MECLVGFMSFILLSLLTGFKMDITKKQIEDPYRAIKDEYFRSLIPAPAIKKKRSCLKCRRVIISDSAGHRRCCFCDKKVSGMHFRAESG